MTERLNARDDLRIPDESALSSNVGCKVVNEALEDLRQALLTQSKKLGELQKHWKDLSPDPLIDVLYEYLQPRTGGYVQYFGSSLVEAAWRLLLINFRFVHGEITNAAWANQSVRISLAGSAGGVWIRLPTQRASLATTDWPYWIESVHSQYGPDWHESIQDTTRTLCIKIAQDLAHIEGGKRLWQRTLDDADDSTAEELTRQIARCEKIQQALMVVQDSLSTVGRNLQRIALATSMVPNEFSDPAWVHSQLDASVGFREIGSRLIELLTKQYRSGEFTVPRAVLKTQLGANPNALNSALAALKACDLLQANGIGTREVLLITPGVLKLAKLLDPKSTRRIPSNILHGTTAELKGEQPVSAADLKRTLTFVNEHGTASQKNAIQFIVEMGGCVALAELAFHMQWGDPFEESWKGLRTRFNALIRERNPSNSRLQRGGARGALRLAQQKKHAVLVLDSTIKSRKNSGNVKKNGNSKVPKK